MAHLHFLNSGFQIAEIEIEAGKYTLIHRHKFNFVRVSRQITAEDPGEKIPYYICF